MTTIQSSSHTTVDSTSNVVTLTQTGNHGLSNGTRITLTANGASATNMSDVNIFGVAIYVYVTGLDANTFSISKNPSPSGANLITFTGTPGDNIISPAATATYVLSGIGKLIVKNNGKTTVKLNGKITVK